MNTPLDRAGAARALAPLPLAAGAWICTSLELPDDQHIVARFAADDGGGQLEVSVGPKTISEPVFRTLEHVAVRYTGRLRDSTERARAEAAALVHAVGTAIDRRLDEALSAAAASGARPPTLAEALGRRRDRKRLAFGRDSLRALLEPELSLGAPLAGGWMLAEVYPSSSLREADAQVMRLVLDFRHAPEPGRIRMTVSPRREGERVFANSAHFSLSHDAPEGADPAGAALLRTLVAFLLQLRDHDALEVSFPGVVGDLSPLLLPSGDVAAETMSDEGVLSLDVTSECHQRCSFCSLKDLSPAVDGGDARLASLCEELQKSREAGVRAFQLNGYDALTYSRILDLLRFATRIGYQRCDVFSPCTTLAERPFCEAVLAALPAERNFHVPLYGASAQRHDALVGRAGAHALVLRALDNLEALAGAGAIRIISVVTKDNLDELPAIAALAAARGFFFSSILPYPNQESRGDRFFAVMPTHTEVAAALARAYQAGTAVSVDPRRANAPFRVEASRKALLRVEGLAPCVTFRALKGGGAPLSSWLGALQEETHRANTNERTASEHLDCATLVDRAAFHAATVPCPNAPRCALQSACSRELLRSYVELHGSDEFEPVSLRDLLPALPRAARSE